MLNFTSTVYSVPNSNEKRVTFGPFNHSNDQLNNKIGVLLYEVDTCWEKFLMILRRIFVRDVVVVKDSRGSERILSKNDLGAWTFRHANSKPKNKQDFIATINRICSTFQAAQKKPSTQTTKTFSATHKELAPPDHKAKNPAPADQKADDVGTKHDLRFFEKMDLRESIQLISYLKNLKQLKWSLKILFSRPDLKDVKERQTLLDLTALLYKAPSVKFPKLFDLLNAHLTKEQQIIIDEYAAHQSEVERHTFLRQAAKDLSPGTTAQIPTQPKIDDTKTTTNLVASTATAQPQIIAAKAVNDPVNLSTQPKIDDTKTIISPVASTPTAQIDDRKVYDLAREHLSRFTDACYRTDGVTLNNKGAKAFEFQNYYRGVTKSPEKLRVELKALQTNASDPALAAKIAKLEKEIAEKEEDRKDFFKNRFPKTFFPCEVEHKSYTCQDAIVDADPKSIPAEVYHGSPEADRIRAQGFAIDQPSDRKLELGSGAYFTSDRKAAEDYAQGNPDNVLVCRIQPGKVGKIVNADPLRKLIDDNFRYQASRYFSKHKVEIVKQFADHGQPEIFARAAFERHLQNEVTRVFFQKLGYDGVLLDNALRGGCSYIVVFNPTKDHVEILNPAPTINADTWEHSAQVVIAERKKQVLGLADKLKNDNDQIDKLKAQIEERRKRLEQIQLPEDAVEAEKVYPKKQLEADFAKVHELKRTAEQWAVSRYSHKYHMRVYQDSIAALEKKSPQADFKTLLKLDFKTIAIDEVKKEEAELLDQAQSLMNLFEVLDFKHEYIRSGKTVKNLLPTLQNKTASKEDRALALEGIRDLVQFGGEGNNEEIRKVLTELSHDASDPLATDCAETLAEMK